MHLCHLECKQFRRLQHIEFAPHPCINVLRGHNAQGKTSVLEAILFVSTSKSHRTTTERDLLCHGEEAFHIHAQAERGGSTLKLESHWYRGTKRIKVNGIPQTRMSELLGRLNVVFFSPEDLELIKGGASQRRRFLDMEVSQVDGAYLQALQRYRQVLRQRNELLRGHKPDIALLEVWDVQLAEHGATLMQARRRFIKELAAHAQTAYATIAEEEAFTLTYKPDVEDEAVLLDTWESVRGMDIKRRQSTRGPHRDDLEIMVSEKAARVFGSQGQQKSAALALKLAEVHLVNERTGEYPILMLDEVLAELDAKRSRKLFEAIPQAVQCLVTTTQLQAGLEAIPRVNASFMIENGQLSKA